MIYLDSCSIVKLIRPELGSDRLVEWLRSQRGTSLVTSALAEVEVPRALFRNAPRFLARLPGVLARVIRIEIDVAIRALAGAYTGGQLQALDAIHLATADHLVASDKPVTAFVTYDKRLATAAANAGHTVVAPGTGA